GVLKNEDAIGYTDTERAAGAALANNRGNGGDAQLHHLTEVHRDCLGDVTFFRADSGERAWRVNQRNDRNAEFLCLAHQTQSFAVTFRVCATKIAHYIFFGVTSFLM